MKYQEAVSYLNSFVNYENKKDLPYNEFHLKRVKAILKLLGDPHKKVKSIHIAGTKGKGSTAAFIASILKEAGYKTGLYTSPHLHNFRERITINGRLISKGHLILMVKKIRVAIDKYISKTKNSPTFFEVYTILAFSYFRLKRINFMVIETGIGGRLDATNVIKPLISVITPVSYEHTDKLGKTLRKIGTEKAGIIKKHSIVISAVQPWPVKRVIKETTGKMKTKLFMIGKDIHFYEGDFNGKYQFFKVKGIFNRYDDLKTLLLGRHQLVNASCAICTAEALRFFNVKIKPLAIERGISNTKWVGRLETISKKPLIVLDGAQNKASAQILKDAILKFFHYKRLVLILGISQDKDIKGICSILQKISDRVILTRANHPRATSIFYLKKFILNEKPVHLIRNVKDALELAIRKSTEDDLILVTGSLFVVAEARSMIKVGKNV